MQIHELTQRRRTDEGLLDLGKRAATAAAKGVGAVQQAGAKIAQPFKDVKGAYTQARTGQQSAATAGHALGIWKKYADQLYASTADKTQYPDLYKRTLEAFVQKNLLAGSSISRATNSQQINAIIDQLVQTEIKNRQAQAKAAPAPTPVTPGATAAAPLKESVTPQEQQLFTQLVQQAALSQPAADSNPVQQGAEIINKEPVIIRFQGTVYGLNDQGSWSNIKTGKVPEESVEAFLNKVAGFNQ